MAQAQTLALDLLTLAGQRLAVVLNQTLGADKLPAPPAPYPPGPEAKSY
ncbi:MAG: hypothetical protein WDO13_17380 [Verrucomicrobiota bacterium]